MTFLTILGVTDADALSDAQGNTSRLLNRGVIADLPLLRKMHLLTPTLKNRSMQFESIIYLIDDLGSFHMKKYLLISHQKQLVI